MPHHPIAGQSKQLTRAHTLGAFAITRLALVALLGAAHQAVAQDASAAYTKMAAIDEYLMADRDAEVALARSAAPASVSRDATILVLGRNGFETAVAGKNGFVCMVDRAWSAAFGWPERLNPKIRAPVCLNPQAARSILPITKLRTKMVLAGRTSAEIVSALRGAFDTKQLPDLESGAMAYMMSKSAYLTDEGEHNLPHLMFYSGVKSIGDWGANTEGSPVMASPFWFFSTEAERQVKGLPSMIVFLVGTSSWSDGTAAGRHSE